MTLKVNIHIFGLTTYTKYDRVFVPVFLYDVTILIFQIERIISSEKWFHYVLTFFFFLKMPNIWVGPDDAKRRKNGEGLRWPKDKLE